jgi:hypothetical protein
VPADTAVLTHFMSTSSLVTSLAACSVCVSLSFRSRTTSEKGSQCSGCGLPVAHVSYSPQDPGEFDSGWVSKSSSIRKAGKFFGHPSACDSRP